MSNSKKRGSRRNDDWKYATAGAVGVAGGIAGGEVARYLYGKYNSNDDDVADKADQQLRMEKEDKIRKQFREKHTPKIEKLLKAAGNEKIDAKFIVDTMWRSAMSLGALIMVEKLYLSEFGTDMILFAIDGTYKIGVTNPDEWAKTSKVLKELTKEVYLEKVKASEKANKEMIGKNAEEILGTFATTKKAAAAATAGTGGQYKRRKHGSTRRSRRRSRRSSPRSSTRSSTRKKKRKT